MTIADYRKLLKEDFPEIEENVILLDEVIKNNYTSEFWAYPWTHGKVTLLGDSAHTQGPYGAIGLNLTFQILQAFGKML